MPLISTTEYARSRKERGLPRGTWQAVTKAAEAGRIALDKGKIDPAAAEAAWIDNTSTAQQERGAGINSENYIDARARREAAQADLAEMEAAKLRGELVRASE